jgi:PAS domain S-box-containing protein
VRLFGTLQDVTERVQAEEALRESEERYRILVEQIPAIVYVDDASGEAGRTIYISPQVENILGMTQQEWLQGNLDFWSDRIHPQDRARALANYLQLSRDGLPVDMEYRMTAADGRVVWIRDQAVMLRDEKDAPHLIHGVMYDITERKQAEEEIRQRMLEQGIIHQVSQSLLAARLDPDTIYATLHEAVARLMTCDAFTIVLDDENSGDYHAVYLYDADQRYPARRIPRGRGLSGQVISEGQTLCIHDDLQTKTPAVRFGSPRQVRSILAVPLRKDQGIVGMVSVQSYQPNVYGEHHRILLETLAAQAMTVIENARLFEETRRRAAEFAALYESSQALAGKTSLDDVLKDIIESARRLFGVTGVGMYLYDPAARMLEVKMATHPSIPVGTRLSLGKGLAGKVAQTRQAMRIDDYAAWEGRSPKYEGIPVRAIIETPLIYQNELIGVLVAHESGDSERKFTEADARLISLFAAQAAAAIQNARLFEETRQRVAELEMLYESGLALSRLLSPKEIGQKIIELLEQKLDWHHTTIRLCRPENETLELLAFNQPGLKDDVEQRTVEERFDALVPKAGVGLSGWALQNSQIVRSGDVSRDARYVETFPGLHSGLYIPMILGDRAIGVISIESEEPNAFSEADERLAATLANQASIAFQNARLYQAVQHELTERKRMDEALRRSEKKYQTLAEISPVGIFQTDAQGTTTYVNPRWSQISGLSGEEALGDGWLRAVPLEDRGKISANWKKAAEAQTASTAEYRFVRPDGSVAWVLGQAIPERNIEDQIVGYVGTITDITERKRAEQELRQSEERFQQLANNIEESFWMTDTASGREIYVSPAGGKIWGIPVEDLCQGRHTFLESILPEDRQIALDAIERQSRGHKTEMEYRIQRADGSIRWIWDRAFPILDETGAVVRVAGVAADITERKQAEDRIQEQIARLNALRAIDLIISSSFDMNISLNAILPHVVEQLNADAADVLIVNPTSFQVEHVAGIGFRYGSLDPTSDPLKQSLAGDVILKGTSLSIPDLHEYPGDWDRTLFLEREKFVSYHGIPLIVKGYVKGILEVFSRTRLDPQPDWLHFMDALASQTAIAMDNIQLFNDLQKSNHDLERAYDMTIQGWSHALDLRDEETEGHTQRVTDLTARLARQMGISEEKLVHIRRGALLHDIGKMGVPDHILLKPGALTAEEWVIMRRHPLHAYNLLAPIEFLRPALDIPHYHHEKWDGSGYPDGLKGDHIPLDARIFAVADVWDALRSDRPYRKGWSGKKALQYIREQSGKHFDPQVVEAFLGMKVE